MQRKTLRNPTTNDSSYSGKENCDSHCLHLTHCVMSQDANKTSTLKPQKHDPEKYFSHRNKNISNYEWHSIYKLLLPAWLQAVPQTEAVYDCGNKTVMFSSI